VLLILSRSAGLAPPATLTSLHTLVANTAPQQ